MYTLPSWPQAAILASSLVLQACVGVNFGDPASGMPPGDSSGTGACQPGEIRELTQLNKSEGIVFGPDGWLYAGSGNTLTRVLPDGSQEVVAPLDGGIGLAVYGTGLAIAQWGESSAEEVLDGALALVDLSGDSATLRRVGLNQLSNPNAVIATPWDTLLVSDDFDHTIHEVTPSGTVTLWTEDVESPNGLVFSSDYKYLYTVSTFVDNPPLHRITLDGQAAGEIEAVATFDSGNAPDGIARDSRDRIYIALNAAGRIVRYDPADSSITAIASGLLLVASLTVPDAAAQARGYNACALYAVQLNGGLVWEIPIDLPRLAQP